MSEKVVGEAFEQALTKYMSLLKAHPDSANLTVGRVTITAKFEVISPEGVLKEHNAPLIVVDGAGTESPRVFYMFS